MQKLKNEPLPKFTGSYKKKACTHFCPFISSDGTPKFMLFVLSLQPVCQCPPSLIPSQLATCT